MVKRSNEKCVVEGGGEGCPDEFKRSRVGREFVRRRCIANESVLYNLAT